MFNLKTLFKPKRILCAFCKQPIYISRFGGVFKDKGKVLFFCDRSACLIELSDKRKPKEIKFPEKALNRSFNRGYQCGYLIGLTREARESLKKPCPICRKEFTDGTTISGKELTKLYTAKPKKEKNDY